MRTPLKAWAFWQLDAVGIAVCLAATLAAYLGGARPLVRDYSESLPNRNNCERSRSMQTNWKTH